jgi:hypothetical protein
MSDKSIVITIEVLPIKKGKREIIVSGAPVGEMPVVHAGVFADVHTLINATWAELLKRNPQPVTYPKATNEKPTAKPAAEEGAQTPETTPEKTEIKGEPLTPTVPEINNDQLVATDMPESEAPAPMLSTLDDDEEDSEVSDD